MAAFRAITSPESRSARSEYSPATTRGGVDGADGGGKDAGWEWGKRGEREAGKGWRSREQAEKEEGQARCSIAQITVDKDAAKVIHDSLKTFRIFDSHDRLRPIVLGDRLDIGEELAERGGEAHRARRAGRGRGGSSLVPLVAKSLTFYFWEVPAGLPLSSG